MEVRYHCRSPRRKLTFEIPPQTLLSFGKHSHLNAAFVDYLALSLKIHHPDVHVTVKNLWLLGNSAKPH